MYFEENLPPNWDLKEAFRQYHIECDKDLALIFKKMKADLITLSSKPTALKSVQTAAEKLVNRWPKIVNQLRSFATETEVNQMRNITNIITNKDHATLNQTFNNNTIVTGSSSGSNPSSNSNDERKTSGGQKRKNDEKFLLFERVDTETYINDDKTWVVGEGINVGEKFKNYQIEVAKMSQTKNLNIESNTHEILALSHILLIKSNQESPMYKKFFSEIDVWLIKKEVEQKFQVQQHRLETDKKIAMEDIVFNLRQKTSTTRSAVKQITALLSDDDDNKTDKLILGVRNLIESLPRNKFNWPLRESYLSCSFVHSILNPIFTMPDNNTHLMWLNTQTVKESDKQQDFVGNLLNCSQLEGPAVIGDVKGEDRKSDTNPCLIDLIRIGMLAGESINENGYSGVIGVHVVGVQLTFYVVSLMATGVYVMLEISTISLPKDFTEIRSYIAHMEDILPVLYCYDECTNVSNKDRIEATSRKMMDSTTFKIICESGKDRKRQCNIVYNH